MTCISTDVNAPQTALRQPVRVTGLARLLKRVIDLQAVFRQRRCLATMDAARLDDLGLSEAAARREAGRPFWDAPSYWR